MEPTARFASRLSASGRRALQNPLAGALREHACVMPSFRSAALAEGLVSAQPGQSKDWPLHKPDARLAQSAETKADGAQRVVLLQRLGFEDDLGDGLVGGVGDTDCDVFHAEGIGDFLGFAFQGQRGAAAA
jgi:hypothetical protein